MVALRAECVIVVGGAWKERTSCDWRRDRDHAESYTDCPIRIYTELCYSASGQFGKTCRTRIVFKCFHQECKFQLMKTGILFLIKIMICRALSQMKVRLKGAQKGHSLLKKKADALTLRFRQILSKIIEVHSTYILLAICNTLTKPFLRFFTESSDCSLFVYFQPTWFTWH